MRERLYIATYAENAEEVIRQNGLNVELDDLCYSASLDRENEEDTLKRMKAEITETEAERAIVHGPFTEIIPASIDHRAVELGMERLNEAFRLAERAGVKRMVVHSGYVPLLYFRQWHIEKSCAFWRAFMEDKPKDFHIYIENVFEDEPAVMRELVESIDDPRVKLCLDVGHASAAAGPDCDIFHWIEVLAPYIGHFHLHNNDGKEDLHAPLSEGVLDMEQILRCIEERCAEDVTLTIESRTCQSGVGWLKEKGFLR